tara:strand:- start:66 stop:254 length:189 start_codon:yes stop_codon:yes gene_type:complete
MKDMKGKSSVKGVYSYSKNPLAAPKQVKAAIGPGANSDAAKANKLLQQAQKQQDSLRGKSGM